MFDDIKIKEIPEDLEKVFVSMLKNTVFNVYTDTDEETSTFINGFFKKHGNDIYKYHLKTFTKKELWKTIILSKSKEFQKMMKF